MVLMLTAGRPAWQEGELAAAVIGLVTGLVVAYAVYRLVRRVPWPRPFRPRFLAVHVVAAPLAAFSWFALSTLLDLGISWARYELSWETRLAQMMFIGIILYTVVAGVSYGVDASDRMVRAEAMASRTQLAALRAQLQPHFLFNALHTVVQLIYIDQRRAAEAAELLAGLLRVSLEEQKDEVTLRQEWSFVSRYLDMERLRFGDRLVVRSSLPDAALDALIPSFALQTLVENAIHHGAARRVAPTELDISVVPGDARVTLTVRNTSDGSPAGSNGVGTGLSRLRERLAVLYRGEGSLNAGPAADGAFEATLVVPRRGE